MTMIWLTVFWTIVAVVAFAVGYGLGARERKFLERVEQILEEQARREEIAAELIARNDKRHYDQEFWARKGSE